MTLETRYVRPSDDSFHALVTAALDGHAPRAAQWDVVESGSSCIVALIGDIAVRVARNAAVAGNMRRAQDLVDRLPELPFAVPRSVGPSVELDGLVATPVQRLTGVPHPPGSGDPGPLRDLLAAVHGIDVGPLREYLAPARSFAGGDRWIEVMTESVLPLIPAEIRPEAARRVHALIDLKPEALSVNHGDLAGSNVLWRDGEVIGVLDWDLTAEDDPAEDVASLVGWHGWGLIDKVADPETVARALVFRESFPLQIVAFSVLGGRPADELQRTVERASKALHATARTSH